MLNTLTEKEKMRYLNKLNQLDLIMAAIFISSMITGCIVIALR